MERHRCKVKFHNRKIVCASQILCSDCPTSHECEDIDIFIQGKYQGVKECMTRDSYTRESGKLKQKTWGK